MPSWLPTNTVAWGSTCKVAPICCSKSNSIRFRGTASNRLLGDIRRSLRKSHIAYRAQLPATRSRCRSSIRSGSKTPDPAGCAQSCRRRGAAIGRRAGLRVERAGAEYDRHADDGRLQEQGAKRHRRPVDRSRPPPHRRAGYARTDDRTPGRRAHPRAGAGSQRPAAPARYSWQDRQDDVSDGRRYGVGRRGQEGSGADRRRNSSTRTIRFPASRRFPSSSKNMWSSRATG